MSSIKAVFFDYDGVLGLDAHGYETTSRFLADKYDVSFEDLVDTYYGFIPSLRNGLIDEEDMWETLCEKIGKDMAFSDLEKAFAASKLDTEMMAIAKTLKTQKIKVGIITDNSTRRTKALTKNLQLNKVFNPIVNGGPLKTSKNDPKSATTMYQHALDKAKVRAEEAIFIDNLASNLQIPEDMGIHVYHFDHDLKDYLALRIYLSSFGIAA